MPVAIIMEIAAIAPTSCIHLILRLAASLLPASKEMELQSAVTLADTVGYADEASACDAQSLQSLQASTGQARRRIAKGYVMYHKPSGHVLILSSVSTWAQGQLGIESKKLHVLLRLLGMPLCCQRLNLICLPNY